MITVFSKGAPQLGYITDDNKSVVQFAGYYCVCSKIEVSGTDATVYLHAQKRNVKLDAPVFTNNCYVETVATFTVTLTDVIVSESKTAEELIPHWKKEENVTEVDETISTSIVVTDGTVTLGSGEKGLKLRANFSESLPIRNIFKCEFKIYNAAGELVGDYDYNNNTYNDESHPEYETAGNYLSLGVSPDGTYASKDSNPSWRVYVPLANETDVTGGKFTIDANVNGNVSTYEGTIA